jgi:hypothetical protein
MLLNVEGLQKWKMDVVDGRGRWPNKTWKDVKGWQLVGAGR